MLLLLLNINSGSRYIFDSYRWFEKQLIFAHLSYIWTLLTPQNFDSHLNKNNIYKRCVKCHEHEFRSPFLLTSYFSGHFSFLSGLLCLFFSVLIYFWVLENLDYSISILRAQRFYFWSTIRINFVYVPGDSEHLSLISSILSFAACYISLLF